MTTKADRELAKRDAIIKRLEEIKGNEDILLGMLDEVKLDLMILALGIGEIALDEATS